MHESLKTKTAKGLLWGGMSNALFQVLSALFGIILLRLLSPADYGKIAVLLVFSGIASSLQESGFIAALCNKKNPTDEEYNAVFWFNIIVSSSVYVLLFFLSPLIADFYHDETLTWLARYLFLTFLISSFGTVQRAYLFGHLMVKQNSLIGIVSLVVSNVVGVIMALCGYAYWGLATQSIVYVAMIMLLCWYFSPWRPSLNVNLRPAWDMFGFSSKLLVANLFSWLNNHVFAVILGRYCTADVVGYYSNARKWNDMACGTINGMVNGVAQPVLSQVREDDVRYRVVFRKMLRFTCFVSFPCMFGLGLIAPEFIDILAGEKWAESAPMLSLLSIHGAFMPVSSLYSNMAVSRGRSDINLFSTISVCVLVWVGLIATHGYGLYTMITLFVAINIMWLFVWQYFAWRMVRLGLFDVLKDILPFLFLSGLAMSAAWYAAGFVENVYLSVALKICVAVIVYCGLVYVSGAKIMRECIEYMRGRGGDL